MQFGLNLEGLGNRATDGFPFRTDSSRRCVDKEEEPKHGKGKGYIKADSPLYSLFKQCTNRTTKF